MQWIVAINRRLLREHVLFFLADLFSAVSQKTPEVQHIFAVFGHQIFSFHMKAEKGEELVFPGKIYFRARKTHLSQNGSNETLVTKCTCENGKKLNVINGQPPTYSTPRSFCGPTKIHPSIPHMTETLGAKTRPRI